MNTVVLKLNGIDDEAVFQQAADYLRRGEIVAIPTETVYGLAVSIQYPDSVKRVFEIKGRPQDNPLIVHVSSREMVPALVTSIPDSFDQLVDAFWPGPLTIVLPKSEAVSKVITCGMDSVALRCPSHPAARAIIEAVGAPLAAPSANLSGKPSTTSAEHCFHDLNTKIPLIVDGGDCSVGVESTVISLLGEQPTILRPGIISLEEIKEVLPNAIYSSQLNAPIESNQPVLSPGMKYKHYAPSCEVVLIQGETEPFVRYIKENEIPNCSCICFESEKDFIPRSIQTYSFGNMENPNELAHNLFRLLRIADESDCQRLFVHAPEDEGKFVAIYNRLIRASAYNLVRV